MIDHGHDLIFGTLLEPTPERPLDVVQLAQATERLGLDLVSLADHPYWPQRLDSVVR
jgi:alkanesulfonate monooxygenase SsuD/methylene tetrahydromethanopterin reductase-like flavin-dependent oxidoreductase (luciferase family)